MGNDFHENDYLYLNQKDGTFLPLMKSCPYLKAGDFVVMYEKEESEIDWDVKEDLMKRLYFIAELNRQVNVDKNTAKENEFGVIKLNKHQSQKTSANSYITAGPFIKILHTGLKVIKVKISRLGNIKPT